MKVDPFSEILRLVNAHSVVSGGFTAGGSWAIRFSAPDKIKYFCVVKGSCWLRVEGEKVPVRIDEGDVFLLPARRTFVLAGNPSTKPVDASKIFTPGAGTFAKLGRGQDFFVIGGHVGLDPANGGLLANVLPALIHIRASSAQAAILRWLIDQLERERAAHLPGASLASSQLAQLIFIQILRVHLSTSGPLATGLLRAISDQRISPALQLMHGDPGRSWHLEELARASSMSRTTFALHFKTVAGVAPVTYLTEWRMHLAQQALREQNVPVSSLACTLGYESESAFSNAFKRIVGIAPKRYRTRFRTGDRTSETKTSLSSIARDASRQAA